MVGPGVGGQADEAEGEEVQEYEISAADGVLHTDLAAGLGPRGAMHNQVHQQQGHQHKHVQPQSVGEGADEGRQGQRGGHQLQAQGH